MANIDLRPWREERRIQRQNRFVALMLLTLALAAGVGWGWNQFVRHQIDIQNQRNSYLESEIAKLEDQLKEIETLDEQRELLINRMNIIQSLQGDRLVIVHVFDGLVKATPKGIYFDEVTVKGNQILISAEADKALTISDFLRSLESSDWFSTPFLEGMESIKNDREVVGHKFTVRLNLVKPSADKEPVE